MDPEVEAEAERALRAVEPPANWARRRRPRPSARERAVKWIALVPFVVLAAVIGDTQQWEHCEDWTEFDFHPALHVPGVYWLEITGDGYHAKCALVLTERIPFWDLDTNCPRSKLWLWHWERALPGLVVPRALRRARVELTYGATVLYSGEESMRGYVEGAEKLRCQWIGTTLMLRDGDQPNVAAP